MGLQTKMQDSEPDEYKEDNPLVPRLPISAQS